jgi:hypothetical protein
MTNKVIYKGLELTSKKGSKYYEVKEGCTNSIVEKNGVLVVTYLPGSTSWSLSDFLGIPKIGKNMEMEPTTRPQRFSEVTISLNGLKLQKMTSDTHIVRIVIVADSESRVVQSYGSTVIVVSDEDRSNQEFINFLFYSGGLLYLKPVGPKPKCYSICNFPFIPIKENSLELSSSNIEVFQLRRRYDDYVIRAIDYQNQFLEEIRRILDGYGLELVRYNKEMTLKKTSHVLYQINQTPTRVLHPGINELDSRVISYKIPIMFTLRATDMVLFFDFKNKYINVDLLTNFCEFKTGDRYGERWTAAIKWGQLTEDFNHLYQLDDNSNFSFQCQFSCELYFYEVFDTRYKFLEEIIFSLKQEDDLIQEETIPSAGSDATSN